MKVHYRNILLGERIEKIRSNESIKIELNHACTCLYKAWDKVRPETISNCFKKACFIKEDDEIQPDDDDATEELYGILQNLDIGDDVIGDYMEIDQNLVTGLLFHHFNHFLEEMAEDIDEDEQLDDPESSQPQVDLSQLADEILGTNENEPEDRMDYGQFEEDLLDVEI